MRRRVIPVLIGVLAGDLANAGHQTLSEQLLHAWFATAGVCTTSSVSDINDDGREVTISVEIEPATRKALGRMNEDDRRDWFSLHCPPQIHGVWRQPSPPDDIIVTGTYGDDQLMRLSCVVYQRDRWNRREQTLKERLQRWIEDRLGSDQR